MVISKAQKEYQRKYRKKITSITIELKRDDKQAWDEYAAHIGTPTATMIRRAVAASMAADGWTVPATIATPAPAAPKAPALEVMPDEVPTLDELERAARRNVAEQMREVTRKPKRAPHNNQHAQDGDGQPPASGTPEAPEQISFLD